MLAAAVFQPMKRKYRSTRSTPHDGKKSTRSSLTTTARPTCGRPVALSYANKTTRAQPRPPTTQARLFARETALCGTQPGEKKQTWVRHVCPTLPSLGGECSLRLALDLQGPLNGSADETSACA